MLASSRSTCVADRKTTIEEAIMFSNTSGAYSISTNRQPDLLRIVADYRYLAVPALVAQERLSVDLAHQALQRDGGPMPESRPRTFRRWLGDQVGKRRHAIDAAPAARTVDGPARRLSPTSE
jgi:hypothetical protein